MGKHKKEKKTGNSRRESMRNMLKNGKEKENKKGVVLFRQCLAKKGGEFYDRPLQALIHPFSQGPNSFYPEKIISGDPPSLMQRPSKKTQTKEGTGDETEDRRRAETMREFTREYGRGVRQANVRAKTKELTGTLPYSLSMLPDRIETGSDDVLDFVSEARSTVTVNDTGGSTRVQVLYYKDDIVAVRHDYRRKASPYWLAVMGEEVLVIAATGRFQKNSVTFRWLDQTDDHLKYTFDEVCNGNSPDLCWQK
ncbi:uncharacterized protein LOC5520826 [Nematostella vectensis]|uniref:uncharacterized protein LOC5520826 n=1 Tax=Nematostella vectensis TaxID=45351 RepID=UPI0020773F9D|nr:uncharacterized protein LOC5520826 [Nematostella vectensis]